MSDWTPDNIDTHGEPMGAFDHNGPIGPTRKRSNHNALEHSDDPAVQQIGAWLADCPLDFSSGMAAHAGLMAGIAIGLAGYATHDLIDTIAGRGIAPDVHVDELVAMFDDLVRDWFSN